MSEKVFPGPRFSGNPKLARIAIGLAVITPGAALSAHALAQPETAQANDCYTVPYPSTTDPTVIIQETICMDDNGNITYSPPLGSSTPEQPAATPTATPQPEWTPTLAPPKPTATPRPTTTPTPTPTPRSTRPTEAPTRPHTQQSDHFDTHVSYDMGKWGGPDDCSLTSISDGGSHALDKLTNPDIMQPIVIGSFKPGGILIHKGGHPIMVEMVKAVAHHYRDQGVRSYETTIGHAPELFV